VGGCRYGSERDEAFFGFGQHYSRWNLKGERVPVIISEQGVGRGLQPLTFMLNTFVHGVGSTWHTTYVAKPAYITSRLRSLMLFNNEVSIFDLTRGEVVSAEVWATTVTGVIIYGETPLDIVEVITEETVGHHGMPFVHATGPTALRWAPYPP
jgi:sulfoquinovosidase